MPDDWLDPLAETLGGMVAESRNARSIAGPPEKAQEACVAVASVPGFYHLTTITAVDKGTAVELMYHFWQGRSFVTVRTDLPKEDLSIESISGVLPAAVLYEAEIQDLFGVTFRGNPLTGRRLLLPDDYPAEAPPPLRMEADPGEIRRLMGLE